MEFKGKLAYLTKDEQAAARCKSPVPAAEINIIGLLEHVNEDIQSVMEDLSDDGVINDERASLLPESLELGKRRKTLSNMQLQLIEHGFGQLDLGD